MNIVLPHRTRTALAANHLQGRLAALAVAALATSISPTALALGLGEITVTSRLGEPLRALVPLAGIQASGGECIELVPGQSGADEPPWLARATLRLERRKAGAQILLTTRHPVNDPILMVRLAVGCGAEHARDYTLLLSPPDTAGIPVAGISAIDETESWNHEPGETAARETTGLAVPRPYRGEAPKRKPARQLQTARSADRLSIEKGVNNEGTNLRRASDVGPPGSPESSGEVELRRREARLHAALEDQVAAELALVEKIRQMEERLAALRGEIQAVEGVTTGASTKAASLATDVSSESTRPAPQTHVVSPTHVEAANFAHRSPYGLWIIGSTGIALLGGVFWRRRQQRSEEGQERAEKSPESRLARPKVAVHHSVGAEKPLPPRQTATTSPRQRDDENLIDVAEHDSALESAEVLLSFGRLEGAAQTLADHIDANPKQTVRPWLRLLEVYREGGMRMEFEALARRLNQTFNIEVMAWDQEPRWRGHDCLENYPHIVARLVASWHSPACQDYLHHLLQDNRNGTRSGFSAEVLEDILLLANLLERKAEAPAPAAGAEVQRRAAIRREAPAAAAVPATPDAAVSTAPRPATQPLVHLLARKRHRLAQHPHVPNVVG